MDQRYTRHARHERFSLARYIIELLAYHWAMEREPLSLSALKFYYEDIAQIPVERRRAILQYVSNILNALNRKELVYLVKRKYVINVPRVLYLYHISLPKEGEPSEKNKRRALVMASGGIVQHLGEVAFPRKEALSLVEEIVKKHYEAENSLYPSFLQAFENFIKNATKFYVKLNKPRISKFFEDKVLKLLDDYLFWLLIMRETGEPPLEFAEELWDILVEAIEDEEIVTKTLDSWKELTREAEILTSDRDFRVRSYARKFIYKVIRIELAQELTVRIL